MAKHTQPPDIQLKSSLEFTKTRIDKFAVFTTNVLGSMTFLLGSLAFFSAWIIYNLIAPNPFDRFPFPVLEMVVSLFAIILSVTVLINQNRQGHMDKVRQQVEFEVNVRAENEITMMLNMLHEIHQKLGLKTEEDKELEEMKEIIDVKLIHQTIDEEQNGNQT
ncbi:MAG: DUF1003 domain-containing protein [Sphingobacteriales bacterium]